MRWICAHGAHPSATKSRRRWLAVVCCASLLATGCGNRLSTDEILAQNTLTESGGSATGASQPSGSGANGPGTASADPASAGIASTDTTGAPPLEGQAAAAPGVDASGAPAGGGAPIVIGFVGWLSGIGGAGVTPIRDTWIAWQRLVNARGGINGHPVELLIGDSGGNDSRALSVVRDFVENRGAIAIAFADTSLGGVAEYARQHSIPVVGSLVVDPVWNQNPMLFPPMANIDANAWGRARLAADAGLTRVGTVYCTEDPACQLGNESFARYARELGLEVVYQGRVSIAQPDFTAECLQARNSGAEYILPLADLNSVVRLAQSCARQGYRPTWSTGGKDEMLTYPELEGAVGASPAFPWFLRSGAPGIDEYVQALGSFAPHLLESGIDAQAWAWVGAKLLELAAGGVSAQPTSQEILEGFWSMQGETVGGLLPGGAARTFTRDQPTPDTFCVVPTRIQDGQWVAPNGVNPTCR